MKPETGKSPNLTIRFCEGSMDAERFLDSLGHADIVTKLGRGGIRIFGMDGREFVGRKYRHGGLLRFLTGDRFLSARRCTAEIAIFRYLQERKFPVVRPFAAITEKKLLTYRLTIVTVFERGSANLLDYLAVAPHKDRMNIMGGFAHLFCRLQSLGVYHRDLHIANVLVTGEKKLLFLDFDGAEKRTLTRRHREFMLWRLWRHLDKMERTGRLKLEDTEKKHLLKTYSRLSGIDAGAVLTRKARRALYFHKIGAFVESFAYGGKR